MSSQKTNQKILILKGLPGSGKTKFAKELQAREPGKWKRVNKDDLRDMVDDGKWSSEREKFILKIRDSLIYDALATGYNVISDDTNFEPRHEAQIRNLASVFASKDIEIEVKFIDTPLDECILNDATRLPGESVGEKVIRDMHKRYLAPQEVPVTQPIKFDPAWQDAVICDIDGTIALHGAERGHFEYEKVLGDQPNWPIIDLVKATAADKRCQIIFVSGRESRAWSDTIEWLSKHGLHGLLFMRKTGDHRKDAIIKREIFDEHIRNKWNIRYVLEDRNQVVALWRSLGLTCLQVAEGNF